MVNSYDMKRFSVISLIVGLLFIISCEDKKEEPTYNEFTFYNKTFKQITVIDNSGKTSPDFNEFIIFPHSLKTISSTSTQLSFSYTWRFSSWSTCICTSGKGDFTFGFCPDEDFEGISNYLELYGDERCNSCNNYSQICSN